MKFARLRLLFRVLRVTKLTAMIKGFVFFLVCGAFAVEVVEPEIDSFWDACWYLFASFTTIGYGDIVATTFIGRLITVVISFYGILVVAFIPAVVIGYFTEFNKEKKKEIASMFLDKLERLEHLSREELAEMSAEIRRHRSKLEGS
ncbi:MAG: potassium channel family protein [Rikenellaceae bacterium]